MGLEDKEKKGIGWGLGRGFRVIVVRVSVGAVSPSTISLPNGFTLKQGRGCVQI